LRSDYRGASGQFIWSFSNSKEELFEMNADTSNQKIEGAVAKAEWSTPKLINLDSSLDDVNLNAAVNNDGGDVSSS
jgi:hypothetical protein